MGVTHLKKYLDDNKITKIFTYNNNNNAGLISILTHEYPGKYNIEYIDSLDEVKDGYIVIPPIGHQNVIHFEGTKEDFNTDPLLTKLVESKEIFRYAVLTVKTFGSSKFFLHLMDDLSYRDILFNDISAHDRYLSNCWLLDAKLLQKSLSGGE
jgi:hypothetical protein